jgi:hypothetical protein
MRSIHPFVVGALFLAGALLAGESRAQSADPASVDGQVIGSASFLSAHPDLRYRMLGLKAFDAEDYAKALEHFQRAARYADKPSQAMIAEMYWQGRGVAVDRPLAYAWMDLAAERHYKLMLVNRERYWDALSDSQRDQALEVGKPLYAAYGDKVAKPRMERQLRAARANVAGSRTGFVGDLRIVIPGPAGEGITIDGSQFFQDKFWKPEAYWAWQAKDWKDLPKGRVQVGPLR